MKSEITANKISVLITLFFAFLFLIYNSSIKSQEVDPFYLNLLNKGEKSLLNGNYEEAIEELEIAAFGLIGDKRLRAKAYVCMSVSYYFLRDIKKSEDCLKDALELISAQDLVALDIDKSARIEVENLLNSFKLKESTIPFREKEERKSESAETSNEQSGNEVDISYIAELEEDIKKQPRNLDLYYELYNIYLESNNIKAAKKTLKKLIKNNPAEINGYYLLGKIEFKGRNYKEAQKIYEKILDLSQRIQIDERMARETRAYLILCSYLRGKQKNTRNFVNAWRDDLSREKIITLSLDIRDKEMLQRILKTYRPQTESDRKNKLNN